MGIPWSKPKKLLKNNNNNKSNKSNGFCQNSFNAFLMQILDDIACQYLTDVCPDDLITRNLAKRCISTNVKEEILAKIPKLDQIKFFTDEYGLEDLEEFLNNCSSCSSSGTDIGFSEEDENLLLTEYVLNGNIRNIKQLTKDELRFLLFDEKIHIKLATEEQHLDKLIAILRKAFDEYILSDIIDLKDDYRNTAVSVAALNKNIKAVYYLLFKSDAGIPLFIYDEEREIPFLMYFAKHGKIYKCEKNQVEFLCLLLMKKIIDYYPDGCLSEHLLLIDKETSCTLPQYLVNIYDSRHELKDAIRECIDICIQTNPDCAHIQSVNMYDNRYKFNLYANILSSPKMDIEATEKILKGKTITSGVNDKAILRKLIEVHRDKEKMKRLQILLN